MSRATQVLQWEGQSVAKSQDGANRIKPSLSSDWGLQLDPMKLELLVIAHQQWRGEYVPGSCTHRPSNHGRWGHPKLRYPFEERT